MDSDTETVPSPADDESQMQVEHFGTGGGCDEWVIVVVKNVNVLVAKNSWEHDPWPGVGTFAPVFVGALQEIFEWPWEHAAFVCTNLNILWTFSLGEWPEKNSQPTIKDVVTRKTKLVGCLPASLWKTAEIVDGKLCKAVFTKLEAHEKTYSTKVPADYPLKLFLPL